MSTVQKVHGTISNDCGLGVILFEVMSRTYLLFCFVTFSFFFVSHSVCVFFFYSFEECVYLLETHISKQHHLPKPSRAGKVNTLLIIQSPLPPIFASFVHK